MSDIFQGRPADQAEPMIVEPDTVLRDQAGRIGWFHHNVKSVGPSLLAGIQGLQGFPRPDPLLGRTFGAAIAARGGQRIDDLRIRSPRGTSHRFSVHVLTRHPSTPEAWLADLDGTMGRTEAQDFGKRRAAHESWWTEFWGRSWIHAASSTQAKPASVVPAGALAVKIGEDQTGANRFVGELGQARALAWRSN